MPLKFSLLAYMMEERGGLDMLPDSRTFHSQPIHWDALWYDFEMANCCGDHMSVRHHAGTFGELESSIKGSSAVSLLTLIPSGARHGFQYVVTHANGTLITWRSDGICYVSYILLSNTSMT